MAIFTPRGLKVRLPIDYSFALMQRLYPFVDASKVLQTTEGFELLPSCLTFVATILCFLNHLNPITTIIIVASTQVLGFFWCIRGLPVHMSFLRLSIIYSVLHGYGIYLGILAVIGFFFAGWQGVVAYVTGRVLAGVVNTIISSLHQIRQKRIWKEFGGVPVTTMSEVNFINAYLFYAKRLKKPVSLSVSNDELAKSNWSPVFIDLTLKWPKVVRRFTPN